MKLWLGVVTVGVLAGPLACGARSDLSTYGMPDAGARGQMDASDAPILRVDAGSPGHDSGHDSGTGGGNDAIADVSVTPDVTLDHEGPACPASYPGNESACSDLGQVCGYPQGTCTCFAGCCGGPAITCADLGVQCGMTKPVCGASIDCGSCPAGETCGGGGALGLCGSPPDGFSSCVARTCDSPDEACGIIGDGCGGELHCPPCLAWGCAAAVPGCPGMQPDTGSACSAEEQECTYPQWLDNCCYQSVVCKGGAWANNGQGCPS